MDKKLDFDDVLIVPCYSSLSSRSEVNLTISFMVNSGNEITCVPIIAANMHNIGTNEVAGILSDSGRLLTALTKGTKVEESLRWDAFETYGMTEEVNPTPLICLDVANGYMDSFIDRVKSVRKEYPLAIIMAGNVVTREGVRSLIWAGADIIKVGLGSGAACLTREKTGVGYPQLSAVMECSDVISAYPNVYLCSDGGHKTPGDVAKSFVAGADFVMLGSMLAGTKETGHWFYGNASKQARVGCIEKEYITVEGRLVDKPHSEKPLENVIKDILGGLRSACTYVGAHNLEELHTNGRFIRIK